MKITEALQAEHVVFHNLFDHIERSASKLRTLAEIRVLANLLGDMLKAHSDIEDKLIIEPLDHCFDQIGQREAFHAEHHEMDELLASAQSVRLVKTAREKLIKAARLGRRHFDREERIVFPLAEKQFDEKTLANLGKKCARNRPFELTGRAF